MNCSTEYKNYVKEEIASMKKMLDKGITKDHKGVDVASLRDVFVEAYRDIGVGKDPSNKLLDLAQKESDVIYTAVRNELTTKFKAGFGTKADKTYMLENVTYDDMNNEMTLRVRPIVDGTPSSKTFPYTFVKGKDHSKPTQKGSSLFIPNMSNAFDKALIKRDSHRFDRDVERNKEIGNRELERIKAGLKLYSGSGKLSMKGAVKRSEYEHGDVDKMKRLLEELNSLDLGNAPDGYMDYASGILDLMHPHFFREMDLFIKESSKGKSGGWLDIDNNNMLLTVSKDKTKEKSNAELYMHEVLHSITHWGMKQPEATPIIRELNYVFRLVGNKLSWKDYLDKPEDVASELEVKRAKDTYDYIFKSEYSKDEFVAHAVTHPKTMKLLSGIKNIRREREEGNMFHRVLSMLGDLVDMVMGNYRFSDRNNDAQQQVFALAYRLAQINNKAEITKENMNIWGRMSAVVDTAEDKASNWAKEFSDKYFTKNDKVVAPESDGAIANTAFFFKVLGKALVNRNYRNYLGLQMTSWSEAGVPLKPEGTIREFVRGFFTPRDTQRFVESASLGNAHIDTLRNTVIEQSYGVLLEGFKKVPNEDMSKALLRSVLDTNLSTLMYNDSRAVTKKVYTNKEVREILTDEKVRNTNKSRAKRKLKEVLTELGKEKNYNWMVAQADGLGYYMATHLSGPAQNLSARNIARGLLSTERHKVEPNVVALLNEIATLNAVGYTSAKDNKLAADIMKDEWKGVAGMMDMYESFKKESRETSFKDDEAHMMDGYTKEVFKAGTEVLYRPLTDMDELKRAGYDFHGVVKPKNGEMRSVDIGMFIYEGYGRVERERGAVNLGSSAARGTDLKEIKYLEDPELAEMMFERDMGRINVQAKKLQMQMSKGERIKYEDLEMGMAPIMDATGRVVNYRHMMSKERKEKLLGQETDGLKVLARTMGSLIDQGLREEQNNKVLDIIKNIMKTEWHGGKVGKDLEVFRMIGPDVADRDMRELYYMLPKTYQQFINAREDKVMAVPADLLPIIFGSRHMAASGLIKKVAPRWLVKFIDHIEGLFMDIVKIAKGNILLKMPFILIGNILSNAFYLMGTHSMTPAELYKAHVESTRSAKEYLSNYRDTNKRVAELRVAKAAMNSNLKDKNAQQEKIDKLEWEIQTLRKSMEESSIHELFEAGLFQSVVEDVNMNVLGDTNILTDKVDRVLDKAPTIVKKGLQYAYLSKETGWYKFNQDVLQLSDLIARDIKNKKMKHAEQQMVRGERMVPKEIRDVLGIKSSEPVKMTEAQKKKFLEVAKFQRMNTLTDSFINYNKPNGKFEEYMNRIGLLMFTKYFKRIQRVIASGTMSNPIRFPLMIVAATLALDIDSIDDQAFLTKGFGFGGEFSFGNMIPVYNLMDHITNVITPAIVKPETFMGLI